MAHYEYLKPAPGEIVTLIVTGGKLDPEGKYGPRITLWNKLEARAIDLPATLQSRLAELGLRIQDDNWMVPLESSVSLRIKKPLERTGRWQIALESGNGNRSPEKPAPKPEPKPAASIAARAAGTWAGLLAEYQAALEAALQMASDLNRQTLALAQDRFPDLLLDLNALAFSLFKAAKDRGISLPVPLPPAKRAELEQPPAALDDEEDDGLPF